MWWLAMGTWPASGGEGGRGGGIDRRWEMGLGEGEGEGMQKWMSEGEL